ncbi:MAG TPA: hypothetical protein ENJ94_04760 [Gammaproteobacteria bacterium]|nr:hypothetical protein [Gammaproteobacteria bacterium]
MNDGGFTDLRVNPQEGQVNESFWPSFTDIMTTVVMIFLIAMVVLLVRNMELVKQLRATMEAERIAAELARATGEEKDSLATALHRTEEQLQQARLEILRLREKGVEREKVITDQIATINELLAQRDDLTQQAAQLKLGKQQLEARLRDQQARITTLTQSLKNRELELQASRSDVKNLQANIASLQESLRSSQEQSSRLQKALAARSQELEAARQAAKTMERKYLVLVGDYDNLKVKYDKLVRPARSAEGRHIVEVRYWKKDGKYHIAWHEGDEGEFQPISRRRLELVLSRLLKEHPNGLYVKVIFPENSGLSYNEAWEFTNHLHRKYDYYFRDQGPSDTADDKAAGEE